MRGLIDQLGGAPIHALPADVGPEFSPRYHGNAPRKIKVCRLAAADPEPMTRQVARRKARLLDKGRQSETHVPKTQDERGQA